MITLHQYPAAFNLPSLSPFCIKVEFFLKISGLPYRVQTERNPAKGPKGKMPFIQDETQTIADSSFILDHLIEKYCLSHFCINDPASISLKIMIEESLYFILLYSRWIDEEGYKIVEAEFSPLFPPFLGKPFLRFLRRNLRTQAMAQGLGRHSKSEVYVMGRKQVQVLAEFLGKKTYFFEDKLTTFDTTAYAFLSTIIKQPIESELKQSVLRHDNLCSYVKRLDKIMEST